MNATQNCIHCGKHPSKTEEEAAIDAIVYKLSRVDSLELFRLHEPILYDALEGAIIDNPRKAVGLIDGQYALEACQEAHLNIWSNLENK